MLGGKKKRKTSLLSRSLTTSRPLSGALFDFGMYFFHNAYTLMERGTGPYFYVAKLESHLEARLWNDVFVLAQRLMGIPVGTIRYARTVKSQ